MLSCIYYGQKDYFEISGSKNTLMFSMFTFNSIPVGDGLISFKGFTVSAEELLKEGSI